METAGIPTVVVAVAAFEAPLRKMMLPRVLLTPFLMGRPIGPVGNYRLQRGVLKTALDLLASTQAASVIHYNPDMA